MGPFRLLVSTGHLALVDGACGPGVRLPVATRSSRSTTDGLVLTVIIMGSIPLGILILAVVAVARTTPGLSAIHPHPAVRPEAADRTEVSVPQGLGRQVGQVEASDQARLPLRRLDLKQGRAIPLRVA